MNKGIESQVVTEEHVRHFVDAWAEFDRMATKYIHAAKLDDLLAMVPQPLGTKGLPRQRRREALVIAIVARIPMHARHGTPRLHFTDTLYQLTARVATPKTDLDLPPETEEKVMNEFRGKFTPFEHHLPFHSGHNAAAIWAQSAIRGFLSRRALERTQGKRPKACDAMIVGSLVMSMAAARRTGKHSVARSLARFRAEQAKEQDQKAKEEGDLDGSQRGDEGGGDGDGDGDGTAGDGEHAVADDVDGPRPQTAAAAVSAPQSSAPSPSRLPAARSASDAFAAGDHSGVASSRGWGKKLSISSATSGGFTGSRRADSPSGGVAAGLFQSPTLPGAPLRSFSPNHSAHSSAASPARSQRRAVESPEPAAQPPPPGQHDTPTWPAVAAETGGSPPALRSAAAADAGGSSYSLNLAPPGVRATEDDAGAAAHQPAGSGPARVHSFLGNVAVEHDQQLRRRTSGDSVPEARGRLGSEASSADGGAEATHVISVAPGRMTDYGPRQAEPEAPVVAQSTLSRAVAAAGGSGGAAAGAFAEVPEDVVVHANALALDSSSAAIGAAAAHDRRPMSAVTPDGPGWQINYAFASETTELPAA